MKACKEFASLQDRDEYYMKIAIREAKKAGKNGDVPIGCVIVYDGEKPGSKADLNAEAHNIPRGTIVGKGYNRRNKDKNSMKHAEVMAIQRACRKFEDWRVEDCTMYVTLEPCPMCAGAIIQARIPRMVMAVRNKKAGFCGSVIDVLHMKELNHRVEVREGVCGQQCSEMLSAFFMELRGKQGDNDGKFR